MTLMAHQQDQEIGIVVGSMDDGVTFKPGMCLADVERLVILETLRHQGFNRTRAARVLGIGIRTLQRKLKEYRGAGLIMGSI